MTHSEKLDAGLEALKAVIEILGDDLHCELKNNKYGAHLNIFCPPCDKEKLHEIRKLAGLGFVTKIHNECAYGGDEPWQKWSGKTTYGTAGLNLFGFCTIERYEDRVIPAVPEKVIPAQPERVERKAVYNCT